MKNAFPDTMNKRVQDKEGKWSIVYANLILFRLGGGGGGGYRFFPCCAKTVSSRPMKLSDF